MVIPTIHLYDETCSPVTFDGKQWNALHDEQEIERDSHRFFSSKFHLFHPEELSAEEKEALFKAHFSDYQAMDFIVNHEEVANSLYLFWAFARTSHEAKRNGNEDLPERHITSTWLKGCLHSKDVEDTLHCMEINDRLCCSYSPQSIAILSILSMSKPLNDAVLHLSMHTRTSSRTRNHFFSVPNRGRS